MVETNLAAPCGIYCGFCRQYLVLKKDQLAKRGFKLGCQGCRIRNKNCAMIRRDCPHLKKKKIEFCYQCEEFPCAKLMDLRENYRRRFFVDLMENLKRIETIGAEKWLEEQKQFYTCPQCGGEICLHDEECYDCGIKINPNKR